MNSQADPKEEEQKKIDFSASSLLGGFLKDFGWTSKP